MAMQPPYPLYWILVEGQPTPASGLEEVVDWAMTHEAERAVADTTIGGPSGPWVSTVFLTSNHAPTAYQPPLLYETMVFPSRGEVLELRRFTRRYSSLEQARLGHQEVVDKVTAWYATRH